MHRQYNQNAKPKRFAGLWRNSVVSAGRAR
jgi:hypothetical protein